LRGDDSIAELIAGFRVDVFVREIDVGLDVREHFEKRLAQFANAFAESSFELLVGGAQGRDRFAQ
jgi:hypothetical protein